MKSKTLTPRQRQLLYTPWLYRELEIERHNLVPTMKVCSKCGELKHKSMFTKGRKQCKKCRKEMARKASSD